MSYLPNVENGAIKEKSPKVKFKRRARHEKAENRLGQKLWREWYEATDWIRHIA
jgi:hypothetical protein